MDHVHSAQFGLSGRTYQRSWRPTGALYALRRKPAFVHLNRQIGRAGKKKVSFYNRFNLTRLGHRNVAGPSCRCPRRHEITRRGEISSKPVIGAEPQRCVGSRQESDRPRFCTPSSGAVLRSGPVVPKSGIRSSVIFQPSYHPSSEGCDCQSGRQNGSYCRPRVVLAMKVHAKIEQHAVFVNFFPSSHKHVNHH